MSKLKIMKDKEVREEEMGPLLKINKVIIFPAVIGIIFYLLGGLIVGVFQFLIFAGLGYVDSKENERNKN